VRRLGPVLALAVLPLAAPSAAPAAQRHAQPLVDRAPAPGARVVDRVLERAPRALRARAAQAGDTTTVIRTADGLSVRVTLSAAYAADPTVARTYVDFLDSLPHGSELGLLRMRVVPPQELAADCGASQDDGVLACYLAEDDLMIVPSEPVAAGPGVSPAYIVAHEYGHHIQNLVGINDQVQQAQQNDPGRANQYSVATELQADCFAGMWVGDVAARGKLDSAAELKEALDAAAGVGDDRIQEKTQGRIDKESWTHGSAEQRQTWFTRGYNSGDPKQCDTFSEVL
jgi:Putative neutral zinc metallopeptidase